MMPRDRLFRLRIEHLFTLIWLCLLIMFKAGSQAKLFASGQNEVDQSQLPKILEKTAAYCRKFW